MHLITRITCFLIFMIWRAPTCSCQDVKPELGCGPRCDLCMENTCMLCKPGYFINSGTCVRCSPNCLFCTNEKDCIVCARGFWAKTYSRFRYWTRVKDDEVYCFKCEPTCTACVNPRHCTECVSGYYGENCRITCKECEGGACAKDGFCTAGCAKGYFKWNRSNSCRNCMPTCAACSDMSSCTECPTGYTGATCEHCAKGYFKLDSNNTCVQCMPTCTACAQMSSCTECPPGYTGKTCQNCAKGYFKWGTSNSCRKCMPTCTACANMTLCTECPAGHYGDSCQNDCNFCIGGACYTDRCMFGCKEGYYEKNRNCYRCVPGYTCNQLAWTVIPPMKL